jgi:hypothetical protein
VRVYLSSVLPPASALFAVLAFAQDEPGYIITRIAGNGLPAPGENGVPAVATSVLGPAAVALDTTGGILFAEDSRIRRIGPDGLVRRIAGRLEFGDGGDGGPAIDATFRPIRDIAVDRLGNIYVVDEGNNRIRRISPAGIIEAFTGNGRLGFGGDGGPAMAANFNRPRSVAVDVAGNVYINDRFNRRIRKVSADKTITSVAGNGTSGFSGDGGPALNARYRDVNKISIDKNGNLYLADEGDHRVRIVSANGIINTVAGVGDSETASLADGGSATSAYVRSPGHAIRDDAGNLFILEQGDDFSARTMGRIRRVSPSGIIQTIAGGLQHRSTGAALGAVIFYAQKLDLEGSGAIYVADSANAQILKLTLDDLSSVPLFTLEGVVNGASFRHGSIAPGEIVTIFGNNLGPSKLAQGAVENGLWPTLVGGTRVLFNGVAAPIIYAQSNQTTLVVPYSVSSSDRVNVVVEKNGRSSLAQSLTVVDAAPGIFTVDSRGLASALNEDGTPEQREGRAPRLNCCVVRNRRRPDRS